jgi:hypothetical protein
VNRRQALTAAAAALAAAALPTAAPALIRPTLAVYDPDLEVSVRFADEWRRRGATLISVEQDLVRACRALPADTRLAGLTRHADWLIAEGEMRARGRRLTLASSGDADLCAWESA